MYCFTTRLYTMHIGKPLYWLALGSSRQLFRLYRCTFMEDFHVVRYNDVLLIRTLIGTNYNTRYFDVDISYCRSHPWNWSRIRVLFEFHFVFGFPCNNYGAIWQWFCNILRVACKKQIFQRWTKLEIGVLVKWFFQFSGIY